MRYNSWKDENDYWKGIFNEKFYINGKETDFNNYVCCFNKRKSHDPKMSDLRNSFLRYCVKSMDKIGRVFSNFIYLSSDYLYKGLFLTKERLPYNPFISLTGEDINHIHAFNNARIKVNQICLRLKHGTCTTTNIFPDFLDAIDNITNLHDIIRIWVYNGDKKHKKPKKYEWRNDNYLVKSKYLIPLKEGKMKAFADFIVNKPVVDSYKWSSI